MWWRISVFSPRSLIVLLYSKSCYAAQHLRSAVYDACVADMTTKWYRSVLVRLPIRARLLDVGIGTGTSLLHNQDVVRSKRLEVVGVDCNLAYVEYAREQVARSSVRDAITVVHANIHDYHPGVDGRSSDTSDLSLLHESNGEDLTNERITQSGSSQPEGKEKARFDSIYFSGSFMLIPDKVMALRHTIAMLGRPPITNCGGTEADEQEDQTKNKNEEGGNIYFTQTFEKNNFFGSRVTPWVKWWLSVLTSVDFGQVTFREDFLEVLKAAEVEIIEEKTLYKGTNRDFVLIIARSKSY